MMRNSYNRNAQICGLFLDVFLIFIMAWLLISGYVQTRDYVSVTATIQDISIEHGVDTSSNTTRHLYAYYKYTYNDVDYTSRRSMLIPIGNKIGDTVVIRCNPDKPEILENTADRALEICILFISILGFVIIRKSMRNS